MKVNVQMTVYEGYADALTGKLSASIEVDYDLPAVPRVGDYVETGYGDGQVVTVFWRRDGGAAIRLRPIYTLDESQESVLARLQQQTEPAALREAGDAEVPE